jgi:hypothetical protein
MDNQQLINYYERRVQADREAMRNIPPSLREMVDYDQGHYHHRVLLKLVRQRAGLEVCSGKVDCVEYPTSQCRSGEHSTCPDHRDTCYLCVEEPHVKTKAS